MRKIFLILATSSGLCAILLFSGWLFLNSSFLGDIIAKKCLELSGSSLAFKKNPKFALFPTSLSLEDISWHRDDNAYNIKFSAHRLRVNFDLFSLLNNQIHIREIFVSRALLDIFDKGIQPPPAPQKQAEKKSKSPTTEKLPFILDRIVLQNSSFSFARQDRSAHLSHINLAATHFGPRQETDIKCDFITSLGGAGAEELNEQMAGNMAIRTKVRYYAPNLTFRQTAITFTSTQEPASLSPLFLEAEGSINLEDFSVRLNSSQLKSSACQLTLKGDYNAPENTFEGHATLDYNPSPTPRQMEEGGQSPNYNIILASPVRYGNKVLRLPDIAISSGTSKGSGKLNYTLPDADQPAQARGELAFCAINLPKRKKVDKSPPKSAASVTQKGSAQNFLWPDIDITFSAPSINYDRFASREIYFKLQGAAGEYDLKNLRFLWASGKAEGSGHISIRDQLFLLKTKGTNINIGKALWELGVDGFQGGVANMETNLAFSGFNAQDFKKSLAGDFSFNASHVKIRLLEEMTKFFSRFSSNANLLPDGINLFSVKAHAENGNIYLNPMLLESQGLEATARGHIVLATDKIDADLSLNVFGMNLPITLDGKLSSPSWHIEPAWFKSLW